MGLSSSRCGYEEYAEARFPPSVGPIFERPPGVVALAAARAAATLEDILAHAIMLARAPIEDDLLFPILLDGSKIPHNWAP